MRYWKIMAGRGSEAIDDFKEKNIIAVGFAPVEAAARAKTVEEMRHIVAELKPNDPVGRINASGSQLFKFYHDIQIGDRVLVYEPSARLYHVGEVTSDAAFNENAGPLSHVRKVHWTQTIPRDSLSVNTRNTLGAILTIFEIQGPAKEEVERRLEGKELHESARTVAEEEQENIEQIGAEAEGKSREFIKDALIKLDPYEMQDLIAGILRAMGYKTEVSPPGADRGIDVFASPDGLGLEEPRIVVQVKHRPHSQMSVEDIRKFATVMRKARAKGIYVSTGGFSKDAYYEADSAEPPLRLLDTDKLASLLTKYYEQCDTDTRALLPLRKLSIWVK